MEHRRSRFGRSGGGHSGCPGTLGMDEAGDRCACAGRPRRDVLSRGRAIVRSAFRRGSRVSGATSSRCATRSTHRESIAQPICGVSYGGLIAGSVRGAVSGPRVIVDPRVGATAVVAAGRAGLVLSAISVAPDAAFLSRVASTSYGEIAAANDTWWSGMTAACGAGINVLRHMFHPGRMARRVHLLSSVLALSGRGTDRCGARRASNTYVGGHRRRVAGTRDAAVASRVNTWRSGRMRAPRRLRGQDTWDSSLVRANSPHSCRGSHLTHDCLTSSEKSHGPAGPLEVQIEKPAGDVRAAVVFAHPLPTHGGTMHTKVVFQGDKGAGANRVRGAALQLPRRWSQRRRVGRRARRDR